MSNEQEHFRPISEEIISIYKIDKFNNSIKSLKTEDYLLSNKPKIDFLSRASNPSPKLSPSDLVERINQENPSRLKEVQLDEVIKRLREEKEKLEQQNGQLRTGNEQLKVRNRQLEETVQQTEGELSVARREMQRLRRQNQILEAENAQLRASTLHWREQAQRAAVRPAGMDLLDPRGYCRVLGIKPELLRTLSPEKFDKLLNSTYRAYSQVFHPDVGGDIEEMKAINAAYDFLKDPLKRRNYGRLI